MSCIFRKPLLTLICLISAIFASAATSISTLTPLFSKLGIEISPCPLYIISFLSSFVVTFLSMSQLHKSQNSSTVFTTSLNNEKLIVWSPDSLKTHNCKRLYKKNTEYINVIKCIESEDLAGAYRALTQLAKQSPSPELFFAIGCINFFSGQYEEALTRFRMGLEYKSIEPRIRFLLNFNLGATLITKSSLIESYTYLSKALSLSHNKIEKACTLFNICLYYRLQGNYSESIKFIYKAIKLFKSTKSWHLLAKANMILSDIEIEQGKPQESERTLHGIKDIAFQPDGFDFQNEAFCYIMKSRLNLEQGKYLDAIYNSENARAIYNSNKDKKRFALSHINMIEANRLCGNLLKCQSLLDEIEPFLNGGHEDLFEKAIFLQSKAEVNIEMQRYQDSIKYHENAQTLYSSISYVSDSLLCRLSIGYAFIMNGNVPEGISVLNQIASTQLFNEMHNLKINTLLNLLRAYIILNDHEISLLYINKCKYIINNCSNPLVHAEYTLCIGLYHKLKNEYGEAEKQINKAKQLYNNIGALLYVGDCLYELGLLFYKRPESSYYFSQALDIFQNNNARMKYVSNILSDRLA